MDAALRRRFYFVDYYPDGPPVSGLLERWLKRHDHWPAFDWLPKVLDEANKRLGDREAAVGPSHFLLSDPAALTDSRIERIWNHAVIPYLEEQLIGEQDRRDEFQLATLKHAIAPSPQDNGSESVVEAAEPTVPELPNA